METVKYEDGEYVFTARMISGVGPYRYKKISGKWHWNMEEDESTNYWKLVIGKSNIKYLDNVVRRLKLEKLLK